MPPKKERIKERNYHQPIDLAKLCYSDIMNKNDKKPNKTIGFKRSSLRIGLTLGILFSIMYLASYEATSYAASDLRKTIITDPSISRRCDALMKQRNLKVEHKQKIMDLLQRNKRLISITPPTRKTVIESLRQNFKSLSRELRHTLNQIQHREESIIRKGCPGITL
jgi:hypothetical protein